MIKIDLKHNFPEIARRLEGVATKQVEYATMVTLNRAAYETTQELKREMGRVFDNPTAWVRGGIRYKKATKSKLVATVDLDFWGNKQTVSVDHVLKAEIHGGQRRMKRFEVALSRIGILPSGMGVVPGAAARTDAHGNMSAGQIVQILSWFKAFGEQGYWANMRDGGKRLGRDNKKTGQRGFAYFALKQRHGKLLPGIYQRFKTGFGYAVKPVMIFVRMPSYKARFDFYGVGHRTAMNYLQRELPAAVAEAVRTAR